MKNYRFSVIIDIASGKLNLKELVLSKVPVDKQTIAA